jgi:hypothetical protein
MEYAITTAFLLAVVAGSFAAVILGGYGVAQLIASALWTAWSLVDIRPSRAGGTGATKSGDEFVALSERRAGIDAAGGGLWPGLPWKS